MRNAALFAVIVASCACAADWPDWRGPRRDGTSSEKNLPVEMVSFGREPGLESSLRRPLGAHRDGRPGVRLQSCRRRSYSSRKADVPERGYRQSNLGTRSQRLSQRCAAASSRHGRRPAGDPETGNVYTFGVGGVLNAHDKNGKLLWTRSLAEEVGLVTTHGGRTVSPVIEGDLVIVSGITTGWGELARPAHRFMAYDKRTGDPVWVSSPGGRPFDTTYSPPIVADVEGTRLLMAGGGDGTVHAIKVWTGEPVWKYVISKRGVNTGVALSGNTAVVTHSEENLDTSEMGLIAAIDARSKGDIDESKGEVVRRSASRPASPLPIADGDRLYQVDNGANLFAFDFNTGRELWKQNLGTIQKASPVLADGKIYVGSENGKFFILKPGQEKVEILDSDQLG